MRRAHASFVVFSLLLTACGRVPILISESQERQMGQEAYTQILQAETPARNGRLSAIVQRVGERIAAASGKSFAWEFRLLDSQQKNAFCLPGGKVAVYTGILPIAETEAGLAVILGHEVAHATERHGAQRITVMLGTQLGLTAVDLAMGRETGWQRTLLLSALGLGTQLGVALPFSRSMESNADEVGLRFTAKAGYDPNEAPKLWERMARGAGAGPTLLSDHPSSASRQQALSAEVPKVMADYHKSPRYGLGEKL